MFLSSLASATAFKIASKDFRSISREAYSVGHICWDGEYEWYQSKGSVYRAHKTDVIDITTGNRIGRLQASNAQVAQYPQSFTHLGSQFISLCEQDKADLVGA